MNVSPAEFLAMAARCERGRNRGKAALDAPVQGVDRERDLHEQTTAELTRRRLYFVHSRMDRAATNGAGTPDYIVAMPDGVTLWLELKTRVGKLSAEQQTAKHLLERSGHRHFIVRSFSQLLEVLETKS